MNRYSFLSLLSLLLFWSACEKANVNDVFCQNKSTLLGSFVDNRDGKTYTTVTIGSQTWMAENLRFKANNSFLNEMNPCSKFGQLYDWATIMNGSLSSTSSPSGVQGLCPAGWHLPSDQEWTTLELNLGMSAGDTAIVGYRGTHGTNLKSEQHWDNKGSGTNSLGFNVYPTGYSDAGGSNFYGLGAETYFLTATAYSSTNAWSRSFDYDRTAVLRDYDIDKQAGMSCRCLKD